MLFEKVLKNPGSLWDAYGFDSHNHSNSGEHPKHRVTRFMNEAKKYVLSRGIEDLIAESIDLNPDQMTRFLMSARLPYPKIWVEYDLRHVVEAEARVYAKRNTTASKFDTQIDISRAGWMIMEEADYLAMNLITEDAETGAAKVWPLNFYAVPANADEFQKMVVNNAGDDDIAAEMLVSTAAVAFGTYFVYWQEEDYRKIFATMLAMSGLCVVGLDAELFDIIEPGRTHLRLGTSAVPIVGKDPESPVDDVMNSIGGAARRILIALALMSQDRRHWIDDGQRPRHRKFKAATPEGKRKQNVEYKLLDLHPRQPIVVRDIAKAFTVRAPKREHDVAGHWCYSRTRGRDDCVHVWARLPVGSDRHECRLCGMRKWRRHSHKRGDPGLGRIEKTYRVEAD